MHHERIPRSGNQRRAVRDVPRCPPAVSLMAELVFTFFSGLVIGCCVILGIVRPAYDPNPLRAPRADLPPATARQLRRARRAAIADISAVGRAGIPRSAAHFEDDL